MMTTLGHMAPDPDRYLLAAFLPDDERMALEQEAEEDPTALEMIRASHELRTFVEEANAVDDVSESTLAFLAASRLASGNAEPEWQALLERLERRLDERPAARETYRLLTARIQELESGSNAEAHFRRIAGSNPPRVHRLRPLLVAAAVVVAVAVTGVLGHLLEDPVARSAHRSVLRSTRVTYRGTSIGNAAPYEKAAAGRIMVLGIWPIYDTQLLRRIEGEMTEPDSADEWLLLGQVRLMLGDRDGAAQALEHVHGPGAEREAATLLQLIGVRD